MYIPPINHTMQILNSSQDDKRNQNSFESKFIYAPQEKKIEILNELKKILETDKIEDNGQISIYDQYISIYDVGVVINNERKKYETIKNVFEKRLESLLQAKLGSSCKSLIYEFYFDYDTLDIGFTNFGSYMDCDKITFSKQFNDLYLKDSQSLYGKEVFNCASVLLSEAYDELIKFKPLFSQNKFRQSLLNSNLMLDMSFHGIEIYMPNPKSILDNYFSLRMNYEGDYKKECNSSEIHNVVDGHEEEILKKSFVIINTCPKWMQEELFKIRKNQILEEKKIIEKNKKLEEERKKQEEENKRIEQEKQLRKQKRLQLVKKVFPFIKK